MRRLALAGICAMALLAAPTVLSSYYLGLLTRTLIFALFAMSLDLLLGYTGLPSLGHAAYFGLGAYAVGLLAVRAEMGFWPSTALALAVVTVAGVLLAPIKLRTTGIYFLLITLAVGQVLWGVAFGWRTLTGGSDGLPDVPRPALTAAWTLSGETSYYYFVLVVFGLAFVALRVVVKSPFGYALVGIRESEMRMRVLGYNPWAYKYVALVIAGFFAGVAGILFTYHHGFVVPTSLSVVFSAQALLIVMLGGAGTLVGPLVGSAIVIGIENVVSAFTERWLSIFGLTFIAVTLFGRGGVVGLVRRWWGPPW